MADSLRYNVEIITYRPDRGLLGAKVERGPGLLILSGGFRFRAWAVVIEKEARR